MYFIAFTTPAKARGLGGFMGNWAEVTMDAGHISVTDFGRTADLVVDGDTEHWVRITSSPHFPDVARLIANGYPAHSGHQVDGVFAMDVYTVAALDEPDWSDRSHLASPDGVGRQLPRSSCSTISTHWYKIVPIASTCSRRWPARRSRGC